jgi:hypothetical protein
MKWTLLVPGALLPAALAPEIARALDAPRLAQRLREARPRFPHRAAERSRGAAHWSWLAQAFGLPADPPVTAPYAWRALAEAGAQRAAPEGEAAEPGWIAHCDPVHVVVARDHLLITELGEDALAPAETSALLALANEAADAARSPQASGEPLDLRFAVRAGHWFVRSAHPVALESFPVDAVLGRSVQPHLPEGAQARAWRILSNEIQMLWHASDTNGAREQRGARAVNALWIHGGGSWQALPARDWDRLRVDAGSVDAAVLQGWLQAGAGQSRPGQGHRGGALAVYRELFSPYAHQAWDAWLARVPAWEERLEQELAEAQRQGATEFELVLCGAQEARSFAIPVRSPGSPLAALSSWAQRLSRGGAAALRPGSSPWQRLAEAADPADTGVPSGRAA